MSYPQELVNVAAAGTLYNTFTTAKSMLTSSTATGMSAGFISLPAGFFQLGGHLEIVFHAGVSNIVTTPGTFNIQVMVGAVIAFNTGNIVLTTTAHTTFPLKGVIDLSVRSVGNGTLATLMGQAHLTGRMIQLAGTTAAADSTTGGSSCMYPDAAPAVGTGFDSTVAQTLDLFVGFSSSNAGNGFQLQQYSVRSWGNSAP